MNLDLYIIFSVCSFINIGAIIVSKKMKMFQPQRDEIDKIKIVPTFGGLSFMFMFAYLAKEDMHTMIMVLMIGIIGLYDDYLKVKKKTYDGFPSYIKFGLELIIVLAYVKLISTHRAYLIFPFVSIIWGVLVLISTINAMNVTDGIDSLASTISIIALLFIYIKTKDKMALKIIVGVISFLYFNKPKAKLYMGDVGSLSLGAAVGAIFFKHQLEWSLLLVGVVLVIQTLTSLIQIIAIQMFKTNVFLMAPIHHHLLIKNWSRGEILTLFYSLTAIGFAISLYIF